LGDRIYPTLLPEPPSGALPDYSQPLQLLAREFSFTDPIKGQQRCFTSRRTLQWASTGVGDAHQHVGVPGEIQA
jgi:tRNA pseudouridine32 synthase / 23S rRNA pseudouridine746 synthase